MPASLTPERWAQVQQLFDKIVDLEPAARIARLDAACGDDPALREEVESLLAAFAQADDLLQSLDQIAGPPRSPVSAGDSRAGTRVGHYEVIEKLGGGGMGVVYKARDTRLKRIVALKFLPLEWSHHVEARQRFEHEAQAASALDHPNICTIHDIGETDDGHLFIAMAYYQGKTLKSRLKQDPLPLEDVLDYAVQIARGLEKAHAQGIVHRDIKPANVMVTDDGVVKVLDFGLAKMAHVQLTKTGTRMGTIAYMSPEQTRGDKIDHRTDLWSLGVVLYEMLAGKRPFEGEYDQAIIYSLLNEDPMPITELHPEVPEALEHVVTMCLEKESDLRYLTMNDLLSDLKVFVQDEDSSAVLALLEAQEKKQRIFVGTAAGLLVLLVLALLIPASRQVLLRPFGGGMPAGKHVAVLPFINNLGDAPEDQALVDGLTQALTSMVVRLETVEAPLWVVPANEVFRQSIHGAREAHTTFGVNTVLEGSVQRLGQETMLTLNLVDPTPETPRIIKAQTIMAPLNPALLEEALTALSGLLEVEVDAQTQLAVNAGGPTAPDAYAFYLQGIGYLQRYDIEGNLDNAIMLFNQALKEDSLYALAYAGLCEALWQKYEASWQQNPQADEAALVDQALGYCQRAGELAQAQAPVLIALGRVYLETGQYQKADAQLQRALRLEPNNADVHHWLGRVYERQDQFDRAEEAYRQAIALKPDRWIYYNDLGIILYFMGRHTQAAEQFELSRQLTPDNYQAYIALANVRLEMNQVPEAERLFRRSIALRPNALAYENLGRLYFREQQYDAAVEVLEQARALNESYWRIWGWLGHAYYWAGDSTQARAAWQRLIDLATPKLAIDAKDHEVLVLLADAHSALGNHAQGRAYLDSLAVLTHTYYFTTTYYTGRIYEMLGEREQALTYIEQALKNHFDPITPERDPWLEALRADPRYQALRKQFLEPIE